MSQSHSLTSGLKTTFGAGREQNRSCFLLWSRNCFGPSTTFRFWQMNFRTRRADHNPWATHASPVRTLGDKYIRGLVLLYHKKPTHLLLIYSPTNPHTLFVLSEAGAVHLGATLPTGAQLVAEVLPHNLLLRGEKVLQLEEESGSNRTNTKEKSACQEDFCQPQWNISASPYVLSFALRKPRRGKMQINEHKIEKERLGFGPGWNLWRFIVL